MGDIINLRRERKRKQRDGAEAKAQANRVAHGRTKIEKNLTQAQRDLERQRLDAHQRPNQTSDRQTDND